ncbi:MAG TPA: tripartite tricarboxylate transporter substrate binding protein [Burkholderiales bacterium]|nr:tripartite tricarboxylate transporter substrate binding protein [Burkholderiales bacterium]
MTPRMKAVQHGIVSALACLAMTVAGTASAQWTPAKPIRVIVPSSAGGSADATTRVLADGVSRTISQRVIVENRAGASGNIGSEVAARAAPDGYTWLMINNAQAANVSLYKNLTYDLLRDFAPVTQVDSSPHVIVVHPTLPVKNVKELVALAGQKPGQLDYASAGLGTVTHLAAEIFKAQAGVDMRHVPYKGGGESLTSIVSGETIVYFSPLPVALSHMRNGRIRGLGLTSKKRMPQVPDIPTVAEQGYPQYEFNLWNGLLVPAKTPREIVVSIRNAAIAAMKAPDVSKRMFEMTSQPVGSTPEEFGAFLKSEVDSIAELVKRLKLSAE